MHRIVLASANAGKVREFQALFDGSDFEIIAASGLGGALEVAETGQSYCENALLKARSYATAFGLPALADDSGLEVNALGGAPGIHSARYGGPALDDRGRAALVIEQLEQMAGAPRSARFQCALVLYTPDGRTWYGDGRCAGRIAVEPRGHGGFGYDPIFLLPELGRTMAELSEAGKNQISHRSRALTALQAAIRAVPLGFARRPAQDTGG